MAEQRSQGTRRNLAKEQKWRELFAEQSHSGLNVTEFCRERGVRANRFYAWRKELAQRDFQRNPAPPSQEPQGVKPRVVKSAMKFAEVGVAKPQAVPARDACHSSAIMIHFADGCHLEVPVGFDAKALRDIIRILRGEPC